MHLYKHLPNDAAAFRTLVGDMLPFYELPSEFRAVPHDEMAFALEYFVGAANGKVALLSRRETGTPGTENLCGALFGALLQTLPSSPFPPLARREDEATLEATFRTLCLHYDEGELAVPLCARVLAFCLLMERSAGAALEGWTRPDPDEERYVVMGPLVVQAVASVPLGPSILLSMETLRAQIEAVIGTVPKTSM